MITVVAILGLEHSGTTLLARMLGTHSAATSVGGIKNFAAFASGKKACTCGGSWGDCDFWSAVDEALEAAGRSSRDVGSAIGSGAEGGPSSRQAAQDLVRAISSATGSKILVDSSRDPLWVDMLDGATDIRTVRVHIFKTPYEQMASAKRKNRSTYKELRKYNRRSRACRRALASHDGGITIPYGAFCGAPEGFVSQIMRAAGAQLEPEQITGWGLTPLHMLGGNRMKRETRSTIRYDELWRDTLSSGEVLLARLIAGGSLRRNMDSSSRG
ncbi:hypothetical protein HKCCSP123_07810 [Rhodobacterales bacterium HKCCSP123]|nr:hypothetical protein [Rhodobacterales bacterium HKCCSP123]